MWTQKPSDNLVEAVGSPVQSLAAGTCHHICLPTAEVKVAAEEEVAAVGDVAAVEEHAAVEELAAVGDQRAGLVLSREEESLCLEGAQPMLRNGHHLRCEPHTKSLPGICLNINDLGDTVPKVIG